MRKKQSEQIVEHRITGVHNVNAQFRMFDKNFFERQSALQTGAVAGIAEINLARPARSDVDSDGNVQFFRHRPVRLHPRVVGRDSGVLIQHFAEHLERALPCKERAVRPATSV